MPLIKTIEEANAWHQQNGAPAQPRKTLSAYDKLLTIIEVVNEDWKADYKDAGQRKYFPVFYWSGSRLAYDDYSYAYAYTYCPAGLCLESPEKVAHMVENFTPLYEEYLMNA